MNCFQQRDCFTWAEFSWLKNLACLHMSFSRGDFCCSLMQTGHKADRATSAWQRLEDTHFFAFLSSCRPFWAKDWCIGVSQGFGSLKIKGWRNEEWQQISCQSSGVFCLGGLGEKTFLKKYGGHQNVILKINISMSSEFSLPVKHRHRPFIYSVPRMWTHLSSCCFCDFKPLESSTLFYFVKHYVLLGIIKL